jgi:hypothetical protein
MKKSFFNILFQLDYMFVCDDNIWTLLWWLVLKKIPINARLLEGVSDPWPMTPLQDAGSLPFGCGAGRTWCAVPAFFSPRPVTIDTQ